MLLHIIDLKWFKLGYRQVLPVSILFWDHYNMNKWVKNEIHPLYHYYRLDMFEKTFLSTDICLHYSSILKFAICKAPSLQFLTFVFPISPTFLLLYQPFKTSLQLTTCNKTATFYYICTALLTILHTFKFGQHPSIYCSTF